MLFRNFNTVIIFLFLLIGFGSGCTGSYETKSKSELRRLNGKGPIRILTVDSLLFTFKTFTFTNSDITGQGTVKQNSVTNPFEGTIPFRRIIFIERTEQSFWKFVWVVPMLAQSVSALVAILAEKDEFTIYKITNTSCPYIYSYNGENFTLEAEAFGTSLSKAFEAQTFSVLPSLTSVSNRLTVRIGNERPETHLLNSVKLFAVDQANAGSVVLDVNNIPWPVTQIMRPSIAYDHSGKNILEKINKEDGKFWKSDLKNTNPSSDFRDRLELQFDLPPKTSSALLIVRAINTDLITEVYRSVGSIMGDATLEFYHTLENDSQLQAAVKKWMRESSLQIEIADEGTWKEIGCIVPEATAVPFTRAIRIGDLNSDQRTVRVRLSSLTDVWCLDAVSVSSVKGQPLTFYPLNLISVSSSDNKDCKNEIANSDSLYVTILPPHYLDIQFDATSVKTMKNPTYILAAQGYFYEWFPRPADFAFPLIPNGISVNDRIAMLKILVQNKNLFLPPIYAQWQTEKNTGNSR
jgi:hypothetical protein